MGDRVTITLRNQDLKNDLNIYLHWGGSTHRRVLAEALETAEPRWNDAAYFNRIIIGHFHDSLSDKVCGMGVGTGNYENEYATIIVDSDKQEVIIEGIPMSFKKFIEASSL